ncbi:protein kinase domain-containing protein [Engelhardtia mirabilis]|uniref:Serine/threonine-protein kinase PrkC n=1 Tax=Engelhardtia mirabilis TaxID=2528011 RepID=A0A518BHM0_9BACT|nr:Serine/threonine-protein kinase PrkC [Planctomycetes bacterium Pla133]QDV00781.1 Serine/threonine-protein kinase PrkC [Planctomycetes bacterium Pla86]
MEGDTPDDERIEALVARVCELALELGPAAIERVCDEEPACADSIRSHLARLERFGMLPPELAPRENDDTYELLGPLGSGGMGVVYRARDRRDGRVVALKTLDPRLALTDRLRARFRREIDAVRRVDHPRVVGVLEVGERAGLPYFTMPFVEGATLGALLTHLRQGGEAGRAPSIEELAAAWQRDAARPPLTLPGRSYVEVVCRIVLDVARGLEAVHAVGVVHRDVKPSNLLIDARGRGNLFDLGLAHLVDDTRLTHTGDFAGSPHYAAPEQVVGPSGAIDARTDLWGLGATLFEALALRPPFMGSGSPEILRQIATADAPRLRAVAPWAPRDLETLVSCCLERDPARRYASAAELAADLTRFLDFRPVLARPIGRVERLARLARRNRAATAATVLGAAILLGTPLGLWQHSRTIGQQRDVAEKAAAEARREAAENLEVSRFLESLILGLERTGREGDREAARELIAIAQGRLAAVDSLRPLTRASLLATVARVLVGMEREAEAVPLLDRSLSIRQTELGEGHLETAQTLQELAALHLELGNVLSARGLVERGLRSIAVLDEAPRARALADENLAALARIDGRGGDALGHLEAAVARYRELPRERETAVARVLRSIGSLYLELGDPAAAARALEQSVDASSDGWSPDGLDAVEGLELLGRAYEALARAGDASLALERALDLRRKSGQAIDAGTAELLERLLALDAEQADPDAVRRRLTLERRVLLGENRLELGLSDARGPFERALVEADGIEGAVSLRGRALVGLARVAAFEGREAEAQQCLAEAARLPRMASPEASWVDDLFETRLGLDLARADRSASTSLGTDLEALTLWFRQRIERASAADRDLPERLRRNALLLLQLRESGRAEELLAGATDLEQRRGRDSSTTVGLDYRSLLEDTYSASMQQGITCLQSERWADAIGAFELCAAARPDDPVAPYNAACAHAHLGQTAQALAALERSVERGYAFRERAVELTASDPDLANLRGEPRFQRLIVRMQGLVDAAEAFAAKPRVWAPAGLDASRPVPALYVLHADGSTADAVLAGPWRELADRLGLLLVAPSGRIPARLDPELGMLWTDSLARYAAQSRYYEAPVRTADTVVRREWTLDPERVFIAGEGLGGTLAFHIAVRSPELFRGCLMVDASVPIELIEDLVPRLGNLGLRAAILADPARRPDGMPAELSTSGYLSRTFAQLERWGIQTTLGTRKRDGGELDVEWVAGAISFLERGR